VPELIDYLEDPVDGPLLPAHVPGDVVTVGRMAVHQDIPYSSREKDMTPAGVVKNCGKI